MPQANSLHFPEYIFAILFLHTIEDDFGKQNQYGMKEMNISCE